MLSPFGIVTRYVSGVAIIFDCFVLLYYHSWILYMQFYIIFGTNLLTQCLVPVAVFCLFLVLQKIYTKRSPNATRLFDDILWTKETLEASGEDQKTYEETARQQGAS
jgi:hypothetical protein